VTRRACASPHLPTAAPPAAWHQLRSLAEAKAAAGSPVVALLVKAAELHVRADLGVVDAAEHDLGPDALAALRLTSAPAASPGTQSSSA
jgi:hypothetical protein